MTLPQAAAAAATNPQVATELLRHADPLPGTLQADLQPHDVQRLLRRTNDRNRRRNLLQLVMNTTQTPDTLQHAIDQAHQHHVLDNTTALAAARRSHDLISPQLARKLFGYGTTRRWADVTTAAAEHLAWHGILTDTLAAWHTSSSRAPTTAARQFSPALRTQLKHHPQTTITAVCTHLPQPYDLLLLQHLVGSKLVGSNPPADTTQLTHVMHKLEQRHGTTRAATLLDTVVTTSTQPITEPLAHQITQRHTQLRKVNRRWAQHPRQPGGHITAKAADVLLAADNPELDVFTASWGHLQPHHIQLLLARTGSRPQPELIGAAAYNSHTTFDVAAIRQMVALLNQHDPDIPTGQLLRRTNQQLPDQLLLDLLRNGHSTITIDWLAGDIPHNPPTPHLLQQLCRQPDNAFTYGAATDGRTHTFQQAAQRRAHHHLDIHLLVHTPAQLHDELAASPLRDLLATWLHTRLGPHPNRWQLLCELVGTFEGTLGQLVDVITSGQLQPAN